MDNAARGVSGRGIPGSDDLGDGIPGEDRRPVTDPAVAFGPDRSLVVLGVVAGLAAAAAAVLLAADPTDRVVLGALAVALLGLAAAGSRVGKRLTVADQGLVIRGVSSSRTVPWTEIARVSAPSRRRMGIASTTLEVELVDDELLLFGRLDLGTDPERVAAAVEAGRPR